MLAIRHTSAPNVTRPSQARSHETLTWKCTPSTCAAVQYVTNDILHDFNYMSSDDLYCVTTLRSRCRHTKLKSKQTTNRCQNCVRKPWNIYLLSSQRLKLTSRVHLRLLNGLSLKLVTGNVIYFELWKIFCLILENLILYAAHLFLGIDVVYANHHSCWEN